MSKLLKFSENDQYRLAQLSDYFRGNVSPTHPLRLTVEVLCNLFTVYGDRFEQIQPHISGPDMPDIIFINDTVPKPATTFHEDLTRIINKWSMDNETNTPDFILATTLQNILISIGSHNERRDAHAKPPVSPEPLSPTDSLTTSPGNEQLLSPTDEDTTIVATQAHRLQSVDIERSVGELTIRTSYYFHEPQDHSTGSVDITLLSPETSHEEDIIAHINKTMEDSETAAMRRYAKQSDSVQDQISKLEVQFAALQTVLTEVRRHVKDTTDLLSASRG